MAAVEGGRGGRLGQAGRRCRRRGGGSRAELRDDASDDEAEQYEQCGKPHRLERHQPRVLARQNIGPGVLVVENRLDDDDRGDSAEHGGHVAPVDASRAELMRDQRRERREVEVHGRPESQGEGEERGRVEHQLDCPLVQRLEGLREVPDDEVALRRLDAPVDHRADEGNIHIHGAHSVSSWWRIHPERPVCAFPAPTVCVQP